MKNNKASVIPFVEVLTLSVLIFALLLFSMDSTWTSVAPPQARAGGAQLPVVTKAEQEGAPLRIVDVFVETPSPERTVIRIVLQNQSDKKIRALAIATGDRVHFQNLTGRASILSPTHTRAVEIIYTGDGQPKAVTPSVDFVEFADGTTWGADAGNSRDRLAGQREGAKAERQRLKSLFKSQGRLAFSDLPEGAVSDGPAGPFADAKHSEEWLQGFRNGVGSIRRRVRQALQTSNPDQVRLELDKPYDTSEDNR